VAPECRMAIREATEARLSTGLPHLVLDLIEGQREKPRTTRRLCPAQYLYESGL
jgi:hypothetical protein